MEKGFFVMKRGNTELKQISNETRQSKYTDNHDKEAAFMRWVTEYAEAHDMTEDEVLDLALFNLEQERIKKNE